MSIRPIDFNGMIQRTQDVGTMKQNEDNRPVVEQQTLLTEQAKQEEHLLHKVNETKEKENDAYRYDAKEKGNGQYEGDEKKKKEKREQKDGKVIMKDQSFGFDIKI